jgi:UDP:flavonoid glycosyltransferase YjiC (YdhE family)
MKIGIQTWGTEGDVRPFVALAGGLTAAGHEVTLAVTEVRNKRYTQFGERLGFSIRHVGHLDLNEEQLHALGPKLIKERNFLKQVQMIVTRFLDPVTGDMLVIFHTLLDNI